MKEIINAGWNIIQRIAKEHDINNNFELEALSILSTAIINNGGLKSTIEKGGNVFAIEYGKLLETHRVNPDIEFQTSLIGSYCRNKQDYKVITLGNWGDYIESYMLRAVPKMISSKQVKVDAKELVNIAGIKRAEV
jgi:hypothetical protein